VFNKHLLFDCPIEVSIAYDFYVLLIFQHLLKGFMEIEHTRTMETWESHQVKSNSTRAYKWGVVSQVVVCLQQRPELCNSQSKKGSWFAQLFSKRKHTGHKYFPLRGSNYFDNYERYWTPWWFWPSFPFPSLLLSSWTLPVHGLYVSATAEVLMWSHCTATIFHPLEFL
jgi:hypothetical protein